MWLLTKAFGMALGVMTDLQIAGGFKDLQESIDQVVSTSQALKDDPTAESLNVKNQIKKFGKFMARKQITPFTNWLPTKNNAFQQTVQFISQKRVESKDIPAILAYDVGVHHWTNDKALDYFGKQMYSLPGYTQISYPPLLEKKDPKRWDTHKWLFENKSVPKAYYNRTELKILKSPTDKQEMGYEMTLPSQSEFYDIWKLAGNRFYDDMIRYKDSGVWKKDKDVALGTLTTGGRNKMQQKVAKYWNDSKKQARLYVVTWDDFKSKNKRLYDEIYKKGALPSPVTSLDIPKITEEGDVYKDEDGNVIVESTEKLPMEVVAKLNANAFNLFLENLNKVPSDKRRSVSDVDYRNNANRTWKDAVSKSQYEYVKKFLDIE